MIENNHIFNSAVFITFSGNCKSALNFYQSCFGGVLRFEAFEKEFKANAEALVVNGSLVSDRIAIHGSDLVHNEGRKVGNYIAIFLPCSSIVDRQQLLEKLTGAKTSIDEDHQKLIEFTDAFDVRWILAIS